MFRRDWSASSATHHPRISIDNPPATASHRHKPSRMRLEIIQCKLDQPLNTLSHRKGWCVLDKELTKSERSPLCAQPKLTLSMIHFGFRLIWPRSAEVSLGNLWIFHSIVRTRAINWILDSMVYQSSTSDRLCDRWTIHQKPTTTHSLTTLSNLITPLLCEPSAIWSRVDVCCKHFSINFVQIACHYRRPSGILSALRLAVWLRSFVRSFFLVVSMFLHHYRWVHCVTRRLRRNKKCKLGNCATQNSPPSSSSSSLPSPECQNVWLWIERHSFAQLKRIQSYLRQSIKRAMAWKSLGIRSPAATIERELLNRLNHHIFW